MDRKMADICLFSTFIKETHPEDTEDAWTGLWDQGHEQIDDGDDDQGAVHDVPTRCEVRFPTIEHPRSYHLKQETVHFFRSHPSYLKWYLLWQSKSLGKFLISSKEILGFRRLYDGSRANFDRLAFVLVKMKKSQEKRGRTKVNDEETKQRENKQAKKGKLMLFKD